MEQKCILSEERTSLAQVGRYTYCQRFPTGRKCELLQPVALEGPQPTCYVCNKSTVVVALDTTETTLQTFVDVVLKKKLGFIDPVDREGQHWYVDSARTPSRRSCCRACSPSCPTAATHGTGIFALRDDFQIDHQVQDRGPPQTQQRLRREGKPGSASTS